MKAASADALIELTNGLERIRVLSGLKERKPGCFNRKS
jgi:hypothetical protein